MNFFKIMAKQNIYLVQKFFNYIYVFMIIYHITNKSRIMTFLEKSLSLTITYHVVRFYEINGT